MPRLHLKRKEGTYLFHACVSEPSWLMESDLAFADGQILRLENIGDESDRQIDVKAAPASLVHPPRLTTRRNDAKLLLPDFRCGRPASVEHDLGRVAHQGKAHGVELWRRLGRCFLMTRPVVVEDRDMGAGGRT